MSNSDLPEAHADLTALLEKVGIDLSPTCMAITSTDYDSDTESENGAVLNGRNSKESSMWAVYNGANYVACDETIKHLPPGMYTTQESRNLGPHLRFEKIVLDELIKLPDSAGETILEDVSKFWSKKQRFLDLGFIWKRGVLMFGPPGSGKTSIIQLIAADFVGRGGLCIFMDNPKLLVACVRMLRTVEPTRPIAILMEDLDEIVNNYGESDILAIMDGEIQVDNVLFVATTNYPEKLDKRLVCRPSRFDIVRKIGMPSPDARRVFLSTKNKRLASEDAVDDLDYWVKQTDGFSVAHLKELIISVEVYEMDVDETVKRLRLMLHKGPSSTDSDGDSAFGFISK